MKRLMITDIRKSCCDRGFDLVTAVFIREDPKDCRVPLLLDEKSILVLESATAPEEIAAIGVHSGNQYIRIRAKPDHGLTVGDQVQLGQGQELD
ncbi:MAG: hypothetical protein PHQ34_07660 [Methanothrix sp.]|nr:hypothetical protein [Methanothrix sp.]